MTFDVWRSHPDKSEIIITAGVDGDEYAGINAAQKLIKKFSRRTPPVPLTIIPLVNQEGNKQSVDYNPLDGRFPKHIYPGFPVGSSSSRLMWDLHHLVKDHKIWIDLHGGNSKEILNPFVWAEHTDTPTDHLTEFILSQLTADTLYSHTRSLAPARYLGRRGTSYLLLESGELGKSTTAMVEQHITWIKQILSAFQAYNHSTNYSFTPTYTRVSRIECSLPSPKPGNLLWAGSDYYYLGA